MARIRTIKPEFFASAQVAAVCCEARVLYIGLWVFADDAGIHPADPKRLKMQVFPGDEISLGRIDQLVDELVKACDHAGVGLVERYKVNGITYLRVTGWHHQKIEKPTFKFPGPSGSTLQNSTTSRRMVVEESPTSRRLFDDGEEIRGAERKGDETRGGSTLPVGRGAAADAASPECPHSEIISLYHEILPLSPRVRIWDRRRQGLLRARWRERAELQSLDGWRKFFTYVASCPFLVGKRHNPDREPFHASLEWLLRPKNFVEVFEGKYEGRAA